MKKTEIESAASKTHKNRKGSGDRPVSLMHTHKVLDLAVRLEFARLHPIMAIFGLVWHSVGRHRRTRLMLTELLSVSDRGL
jgi:hypothetical protein